MSKLREIFDRHSYNGTNLTQYMSFDSFQQAIADYEKSKWVSVTEKLPTEQDADENGKVLVWRKMNKSQEVLSKSILDFSMVRFCEEDSFWMSLPTTPKP